MSTIERTDAILLRGPVLLLADTLEPIATLGPDDLWRTPDGIVTDAVSLPTQTPAAVVTTAARAARDTEHDRAWRDAALEQVRALAVRLPEITTDEVWAELRMPPRESRQIGALMTAAQRAGWITSTDRHRPSGRRINNRRPVRIWKSQIHPR